jgi:hypothetical protein
VLSDIEPVVLSVCTHLEMSLRNLPEVEIIHRSLLVSHINVEGEQIDGRQGPSTEHLEEIRQPVAIEVRLRRRRVHVVIRHFDFGFNLRSGRGTPWNFAATLLSRA